MFATSVLNKWKKSFQTGDNNKIIFNHVLNKISPGTQPPGIAERLNSHAGNLEFNQYMYPFIRNLCEAMFIGQASIVFHKKVYHSRRRNKQNCNCNLRLIKNCQVVFVNRINKI